MATCAPLHNHQNKALDQSKTSVTGAEQQGKVMPYVKSLDSSPTDGFHSSSATSASIASPATLNDILSPISNISSIIKGAPETSSGSQPQQNTSQGHMQVQDTEKQTCDATNGNGNPALHQLGDSVNSGKKYCEHNDESRLENPHSAKEDEMIAQLNDRPFDADDCYPLSGEQKEASESISNERTQDGHTDLKRKATDNYMNTNHSQNAKRIKYSPERDISNALNSGDDESEISESGALIPLPIQDGTFECITETGLRFGPISLKGIVINSITINGKTNYYFQHSLGDPHAIHSRKVAMPRRRLHFTQEEDEYIVELVMGHLPWKQIHKKYNERFATRPRTEGVIKTHHENLKSKTTRRNPVRAASKTYRFIGILGRSPSEYIGKEEPGEYFLIEWYDNSTTWEPRECIENEKDIDEFEKDYNGFNNRVTILRSRGLPGNAEYLLRWDGCEEEEYWFPEEFLCPDLVKQYKEYKLYN